MKNQTNNTNGEIRKEDLQNQFCENDQRDSINNTNESCLNKTIDHGLERIGVFYSTPFCREPNLI